MKKKKALIGIIIAIVVIAIVICLVFLIINNSKKDDSNNSGVGNNTNSNTNTNADNTARIEQKGWDPQIVSDLTSNDVPVPSDFNIAQDNATAGVIIQDKNSGAKYLFIPYQENVTSDVSEYYANINTTAAESNVLNSIQKYGGFFVLLNSSLEMEDLKTISQEDYDFQSDQFYLNSYAFTSVNSHILSKEEIAQILTYTSNINLGENTIGAQALVIENFSDLNVEVDETSENIANNSVDKITKVASVNPPVSYVAEEDSYVKREKVDAPDGYKSATSYVYMLESNFYPTDVPIPAGFKYCVTKGVVSIQDSSNPNLIYIWVPLSIDSEEDITNSKIKNSLKAIYENYTDADGDKYSFDEDSELYKVFNETTETLSEEHIESIKEYGGFYLSEAEFGYDSSNEYYNKARGMVDYSATNTINGGDYYRDTTTNGLTFDKMNEIANGVYDDTASVNSHLVYGIEYDAAMLWIANTYSNYKLMDDDITTILVANSTNVGKYSNSNLSANSTIFESSAYFNGLWGLGGNLAEVTQERYGDQYILRGGSFTTTGEDAPMASRKISDTTQGDNIGFRTALYVKPNLSRAKKASTYEQQYTNDIVTSIDNVEFTLTGNLTRWTNDWDGAPVYEKPSVSSNVLGTLPFATELTIDAKANSAITTDDGQKIVWVRALAENDQYVYLNANDLTDTSDTIGNDITFVRGGGVTRYYKAGMAIYEGPSESDNKILTTTYVGAITAIGKSVNQEWTIVNSNGTEGFVKSNDLTPTANTKQINNISFVIGDNQTRYVLQDNATVYRQPDTSNQLTTLKYADTVTIHAKSEDGTWAEVTVNGSTAYINCNFLTTEKLEPIPEPEPEPKPEQKPSTPSGGSSQSKPSTPAKDPTPAPSKTEKPKSKKITVTATDINSYDSALTTYNVKNTNTTIYANTLIWEVYFNCSDSLDDITLTINNKRIYPVLLRKDSSGMYYYSATFAHQSDDKYEIDYTISSPNCGSTKKSSIVQHVLAKMSKNGSKMQITFPLGQYISHTEIRIIELFNGNSIGVKYRQTSYPYKKISSNTYSSEDLNTLNAMNGFYVYRVRFIRNGKEPFDRLLYLR